MGEAAEVKAVEIVRADRPVMTVEEAQQLERRQAKEVDYYSVFLKDDATQKIVRIRTVVWQLDADRRPVYDENGHRKMRNPHDVALDVWAAYGADDHTLDMVTLSGVVVATPDSIATELAMAKVGSAA